MLNMSPLLLIENSAKIAAPFMRVIFHTLLLLTFIFVAGCATSGIKEPPRLNLTNIQIADMGLVQQEFLLTMKIQNPNDQQLDIRGMDFAVELNGEPFATGVSNQHIVVPAYGETSFDVAVSSTISGILNQLDKLVQEGNINYLVKGKMKLSGVPVPIPFKQTGEIALLSRK